MIWTILWFLGGLVSFIILWVYIILIALNDMDGSECDE